LERPVQLTLQGNFDTRRGGDAALFLLQETVGWAFKERGDKT
jgi:hypothetical protein